MDIALNADAAHDLMASLLEKLPAGLDATALLHGGRTHAIHMRGDALLTQHQQSASALTVRVAKLIKRQWHTHWTSTEALDPNGLQQMLAAALDALSASPASPDFIPSLEAARFSVLAAAPSTTPTIAGPAFHANEVARTVIAAQRHGFTPEIDYVAGFGLPRWFGSDAPSVIANHFGGFAFHASPWSRIHLRLTHPSGYTLTRSAEGTRRAHTDGDALVSEVIDALGAPSAWPANKTLSPSALAALKPQSILLDRNALSHLLPALLFSFSARLAINERSPLSGTQGRTLFSDRFSLRCDPTHPEHLGAPFDDFGAPGKPLVLVDRGKVREFVYDATTAKDLGITPTGHTLIGPHGLLEAPRYPVLEASPPDTQETLANLLQKMTSGLFITRLASVEQPTRSPLVLHAHIAEAIVIQDGKPTAILEGGARLRIDLLMAFASVDGWGVSKRVAGIVLPPLHIKAGFELLTS